MSSYPSSSEEFACDVNNCEADLPRVRDVSGGPPLPRDHFERACSRIYANSLSSLCVTVNFVTGARVIQEVVPYPRSILPSIWDVLDISRALEAEEFAALWAHRRVERLLRLGQSGRNAAPRGRARAVWRLPERLPEPLRPSGRGHGRPHGR
ncbi:uncharacterized protein LOC112639915 [Camponotus floridanus]|uniref:uncharacterized protein LOC112639915 n=1 Tax=Camponotus floridanus TaxID=104421 RepID=UPI000DC6C029|nr:uncharacterized protein LOC112639915 [Camponotus floridanus]